MNCEEEVWKPIKGFEGLYSVSNFGRVKSFIDWNGKKYVKKEHIINGWVQEPNKKYNIDLDELLEDFKSGKTYKELKEKYSCSQDILATRKYRFRKEGLLE